MVYLLPLFVFLQWSARLPDLPSFPTRRSSDLMKQLGVSRNALREAIKALQALGFVEVRHGTGTYVGVIQTRVIQGGLVFRLQQRSEEHTSELQSRFDIVCRLLLEKKNLA